MKHLSQILLPLPLLFIACSENGTSNTIIEKDGTSIVASINDLPKCSANNEGEQIFVKNLGEIRICADGKWFGTSNTEPSAMTCSTESLQDSSGIKIMCNGDSVGVVLNGKDGAQGERGEQGLQGIQGEKGEKGDAGADGKDGSDGVNGLDGAGCSVVTLADNSGLKVVCGGDSVGVVLNGKDGVDGQDGVDGEGTRCALVTIDCIVNVACGKDTVSLDIVATDDACKETVIVDEEKIAVSLDSVKGASQKGPFLGGSKVLVKELKDGRSLTQTGNNFDGKILNDKGEFKISARMLVSQYVMLEANGYYRNEVTGENSTSPLTLFGITDVTTRNIVNINLLTHLEYERVIYLVTKKKMIVHEAKKKAQKEIFDILHIDNSDFSNSEDLSIAGSSDEDGALLAFSILFQGDRSVSLLTELLTKISTAMEKEGVWDDDATKLKIAKWAADADSADRLADFRRNVEQWNLSAMVPNFEKYIRNFWYKEYGLDECSEANAGVVVAPSDGPVVGSKTRYICHDGLWKIASDEEKDTYRWSAGSDGELAYGDVNTDVFYVYDAVGVSTPDNKAGWRKADDVESQYGGCRDEMFGEIRKDVYHSAYYRCDEDAHKWLLETRYVIIDTQKWPKGSDGDVKWGDTVTTNCYVYDDANKGWRSGNDSDCKLKLMGCTVNRLGERRQSPVDKEFYSCSSDLAWTRVTNDILLNTDGYECVEGTFVFGKLAKTSHYVCDNGTWRAATIGEETVGAACIASAATVFNKDSLWTCIASNWRHSTVYDFRVGTRNYFNPDKEYGELLDERDGRVYKTIRITDEYGYDQTWMAENLNYADTSVTGSYYLRGNNWCYNNDSLNCLKGGRYYTWTATMDIDSKWLYGFAGEAGLIQSPHRGVCPEGWHIPDGQEWNDLYDAIGTSPVAMQALGNAEWPNATNRSGFSLLPVGMYNGGSPNVGSHAYYWLPTEKAYPDYAYAYNQNIGPDGSVCIGNADFDKKYCGYSVRCLQDQN